MKSRITLVVLILAISLSCKKNGRTIRPEIKTLTEAVFASGNIYPKNEYQVYANADGLLSKIYVQSGDEVLEGQPLFKIDSDMLNARLKSSNAIYQTAIENFGKNSPVLADAKNQVETAQLKLDNDSITYIRYKALFESNATTNVEFDRAALTYKISKKDLVRSKENLERVRKQLYVELQNAESQYFTNSTEGNNYLVKALLSGMVYEVYKEKGEAIRRNDPIALLGDDKDVYIRLAVDELDIEKIKIGQEVLVKVDLYRDKVFKAKISKIYKKMNVRDQTFRVDAEFVNEKPTSYYGLTLEANIIINTKKNTLVIPKNILPAEDSVWVKTSDGVQKIKFKRGIEDFDYVEVLGGLNKESELVNK